MQIFGTIALIIIAVVVCKMPARRSGSRKTPDGYHHDYNRAINDINTKGKNYYYKNNLAGKYDVKNKK